jgi:glycosyltransferase involved in cell wall biosynthesis
MKVLMVVNQLRAGGAEVLAADLARGLTDDGIECRIAALHTSDADLDDLGVPTTVLGGSVSFRRVPRAVGRLVSLCLRERPDILHSHGEAPDLASRIACQLAGIPHVVTAHIERPWAWRPRLGMFLERRTAFLTTQYIAVSDAVARVLRESVGVPAERVRVIPNWACQPMEEASVPDIPARGTPTLVHVARLHVQKGQDVLLEAFRRIRHEYPSAVLWIVGEGPEETSLRRRAGAGVVFLGYRRDVRCLLRAADLFVLSSRWEGQPLSMLEAMAEGLPVVVTSVGGIAEVIEHGVSGVIVPPDDAAALADAVVRCLRDPDRTRLLGEAANRSCVRRREAALIAYRRTYQHILGRLA